MTRVWKLAAGSAALMAVCGAMGSANAYIIDTFDQGGANASTTLPTCTDAIPECTGGDGPNNLGIVQNAAAGDAIGGYRDITAWMQSKPSTNPAAGVAVAAGFGRFALSSDDGTVAHSWIQWDGNADQNGAGVSSNPLATSVSSAGNTDTAGNSATLGPPNVDDINYGVDRSGLGGIDLTANGENAVQVDFVTSDSDVNQVFLWFWEVGADPEDYATALFQVDLASQVPTTLTILMEDFTFNGNADMGAFTNVGAIQLHMHGRTNQGNHEATDMSIDNVLTVHVPVPASLALLGAGLLGVGVMGRRRS